MEEKEKELLNKLKYLIKKKTTIDKLQQELDVKEYEVFGLVEILKQDGWKIVLENDKFLFQKEQIIKEADVYNMPIGKASKLMLISDTHLGSRYDRLDILRYIYEYAEKNEIDTVLHAGDLTDGHYPNRSNHQYELRAHGADEQLDYVVNKYPKRDGIQTLFIGGN